MRHAGGMTTIGGSKLAKLGGPLVAIAAACTLAVPGAAWAASSNANPASANGQTHACANPGQNEAQCGAIRLDNPAGWQGQHGNPNKGTTSSAATTISGYYPTDLQSAYGLTTSSATLGAGKTVAIVDAYDDPTALSDVQAYRSQFGLPALNASGPTFTQAYATGTKPSGNAGWGEEESLDVDMASAICPNCNIMLVEAASSSYVDLATAVRYAAAHGANAISNSYGGGDSSSDSTYDGASYFNFAADAQNGIAVTVSSGDNGYGVEYPAASKYVTAVGGTHLTRPNGVWSETVWSGAGSGCSRYEAAPTWQPKTSLCSTRTVADVSADADPNTGVAVYDTDGEPGWMVFGGTSVASPIIASVYALAGGSSPQALYGSTALHRVSSGANSSGGFFFRGCTSYLCNAGYSLGGPKGIAYTWNGKSYAAGSTNGVYFNGPTGNGTPNGITAF